MEVETMTQRIADILNEFALRGDPLVVLAVMVLAMAFAAHLFSREQR
jgi:hypothetical protein